MAATQAQLEAVLNAASVLLGARQDCMDTVDEWLALARAVAACTGRKPVVYLSQRDIQHVHEYEVAWDEDIDGALPEGED